MPTRPRTPARRRSEEEAEGRRRIVSVCRRMYERGLIAGADGNVSVRLGDDRLLITPSGLHKGDLAEEDLVITDRAGKPLAGRHRPSSEILMHLLCYDLREEVRAVVHAHPVHAVALAMAGVSLANCILPESCLALGHILTAPYSTPGTEEVPAALARVARRRGPARPSRIADPRAQPHRRLQPSGERRAHGAHHPRRPLPGRGRAAQRATGGEWPSHNRE